MVDEITIKKPGPTSKARWMMRVIYVFKMLLLQDHFPIPPEHFHGVQELAKFYVHIYAVPWLRAPFVCDAAFLDLNVWKNLQVYTRFITLLPI